MIVLVVGAGCAAVQDRLAEAGGAPKDSSVVGQLLVETARVLQSASGEQQAALVKARQAFQVEPTDANRARYATLLALLPPPARDETLAESLLRPLAPRTDSALGHFANLLAAQIGEHAASARDRERAVRASEKREDSLKQQNDQLRKENEGLRQHADALKQQQETLRGQIEALRSIERGILRREDRLRTK